MPTFARFLDQVPVNTYEPEGGVVANPTGSSSIPLTSLRVDNVNYVISGSGSPITYNSEQTDVIQNIVVQDFDVDTTISNISKYRKLFYH